MSIDRTREVFARAVMTMAIDEGSLRARVWRAFTGYLLLLEDGELPKELRPSFRRLGSILSPARDERGLTSDLEPLSEADVRRAARLLVELNGQLNSTWRPVRDPESAQALHDRRRFHVVS
jgi:hypothetical protein